MYTDVENHPAWHDYLGRMQRIRGDFAQEILTGSLDKWGNSRDNEKRAVLLVLDRLLTFPSTVAQQFVEIDKHRAEQEKKLALSLDTDWNLAHTHHREPEGITADWLNRGR